MATVVSEFLQVMDINSMPPQTLSELIPYILNVEVGIALVSGAFGVFGRLLSIILDMTRWR